MSDNAPAGHRQGRFLRLLHGPLRDLALIALVMFVAAAVGTLSRPLGFLAAFWPANALLAGLLTRVPRFRAVPGILAAAVGYQAAALVLGDGFGIALLLTAANLAGAVAFVAMFGALEPVDRALSRPQGVISMVVIAGAASGVGALIGGVAVSTITQQGYIEAVISWFASELVNYLALLPVMLTLPPPSTWLRRPHPNAISRGALPVLSVVLTLVSSLMVRQPIAIVFPVPALIWCAQVLPMSATTVLVMLYSGLAMVGLKLGVFDSNGTLSGDSITSTHLAVALVALIPVVIASVNADRRRLVEQAPN